VSDVEEVTRATTVVQIPAAERLELAAQTHDCLVVIYSKEPRLLGKRFVLEFTPVCLGRGAENDIVLHGYSVSRRHARLDRRNGSWWLVDIDSTNGTYVNDKKADLEVGLVNGDRLQLGPTILKYLSGADVEAKYHEEIYRMTIIDGLTQAYQKRHLLEVVENEIARARRHARDLSFVMLDIDHFKRVNDVHGHIGGDYVLRELSRIVLGRIRRDEVFARYGGDEFALVLPETNLEGARSLIDGIREMIQDNRFVFRDAAIEVTVSAGIAQLADLDRAALDLVRAADAKLYEAKRHGRNRVAA
jgi:two-component system cell cycle response regulator